MASLDQSIRLLGGSWPISWGAGLFPSQATAPFLLRRFAAVGALKGWDRVMAWRMLSASVVSLASGGVLAAGAVALARVLLPW